MLVKHLIYAGYNSKWKADLYARTPERKDEWEWAISHPERHMPGLPAHWRPDHAINVSANMHFLHQIWHTKECLGEVTLILDGAYGSYRRKADFIADTIQAARAGGFRGEVH